MYRKLLTACAALGLLVFAASGAEARSHVDFHIGIGLPVYGGYVGGGYYAPPPPPPVAVYVPRPPVYYGDDEDSCAPVIVGYRPVWSYRYGHYVRRPIWDTAC